MMKCETCQGIGRILLMRPHFCTDCNGTGIDPTKSCSEEIYELLNREMKFLEEQYGYMLGYNEGHVKNDIKTDYYIRLKSLRSVLGVLENE